MVFRAPGFSHPSVAPPVRVGLALALTFAVAPAVHAVNVVNGSVFALAIASETFLGAAIGAGASLLYDAAYYAGRLIDDYVGIRGSVPNAEVTSAQAFGRIWSAAFLGGFFLLDGFVPIVRAFASSFARVPPGGVVGGGAWTSYAIALPTTLVEGALLIAAPALAVALTVHVALAAVARVVPRLASFSLGFGPIFGVGLAVVAIGIPLLAPLAARPWLVLPFRVP
jgi:flagellar biosynthetic protein FliR